MTTTEVSNIASINARAPKSTLGKQDFLNLLVMQMKHQDPLDPMKGTEFAAQLAQFSSLEQLTNLNSSMTASLDANAILAQSINNGLSATFIGKNVRAAVDTFRYTGSGEVQMGYTLPKDAETVTIKIYDSSGNLVKTMTGDTDKGENTLEWDGTTVKEEYVAEGEYHFTVEAKDSNGTTIPTDSYIFGEIAGVRFKPEGTVFVIDGMEIALGNILEIMGGG
ncbi:MAG: flagellar hook capping protein [Bacteroidetes bacterium]|nr:flagellar hook capping protein [Bacteroidota bacterium]